MFKSTKRVENGKQNCFTRFWVQAANKSWSKYTLKEKKFEITATTNPDCKLLITNLTFAKCVLDK